MFNLYGDQFYVGVILHPPGEQQPQNSEIHLYKINKDAGVVQKAHVLRTTFNGSTGLAMHSIDDVLVVHNRKAGQTCFFDVGLAGESDGTVSHHIPVGKSTRIPNAENSEAEYPTHWVIFAPDVVIDANLGFMWKLRLKLSKADDSVSPLELPRLIGFLLQRQEAKRVLLDTLIEWCHHHTLDLTCIGSSFDRINREYRLYIDQQLAPNLALPASAFPRDPAPSQSSSQPSKVILDQSDIYTNIMSPLLEKATLDKTVSLKKVIAILIEYLRSLEERQIPAQHFLHELLINLLVRSGQFYQLHQLLQYHIISDSKPLACLLLSLEAAYPASFQLAMDMLCRLKTSDEEITEILLSKGQVISALLLNGQDKIIPARKYLEAAKATGDDAVLRHCRHWLKEHKLLTAKDAHDYAASDD